MLAAVALLAVAPLPRPLAAAQARLPVPLRQAMERIVWTPARVDSLILALPQVETHLHLDGALSPRTIRELAIQQNYKPLAQLSVSQIARKVVVQKKRDSLGEVLQAFRTIYPLLRTPQAVEEMAYQAVAAAKRQRVMYFEGRFAPALHTTPTFSQEQVLEAVLRGLERGRRDTGVRCGVIICLLRGIPGVTREDNAQMARLAIAYKDRGVVGLDLAGNEAAEPLSDFAEFFRQAKQAGLRTTAHVG
ncbi:MAG: hypothetical protein KGK30_08245, partial [Elusimicrobia bacterium]|nr:hypothetical protein [Elusimicrobiota bacterium]